MSADKQGEKITGTGKYLHKSFLVTLILKGVLSVLFIVASLWQKKTVGIPRRHCYLSYFYNVSSLSISAYSFSGAYSPYYLRYYSYLSDMGRIPARAKVKMCGGSNTFEDVKVGEKVEVKYQTKEEGSPIAKDISVITKAC